MALTAATQSVDAPDSVFVRGDIDQGFVSSLDSQAEPGGRVRVSSGGGSADSALLAARILSDRQINLTVDSYCVSACAEFLIPAAASVSLGRSAVIAFHGNDIAYAEIARRLREPSSCSSQRLPELLSYYARHRMRVTFSNDVERRIGRHSERFEQAERDCAKVVSRTEATYWYPTSTQLRALWGLEIHNDICADNERCILEKIFPITDEGDLIVIGDRYFSMTNGELIFVRDFTG